MATVEPQEEAVYPLSANALVTILANASRVEIWLLRWPHPEKPEFFLDPLDGVIVDWANSPTSLANSSDDVIEIFGAASGRSRGDLLR